MDALPARIPSELLLRDCGGPLPRKSGLYCGLPGGKEELQKGADALGPGGFVVLPAVDHFEVQVVVFLPASLEQRVAESGDVSPRS